MKIKQIQINHPLLGEIVINGEIEKGVSEKIGDIVEDHSKRQSYYHADIMENEDKSFCISNIGVIEPEIYMLDG